jgi:hypothetical protein
LVIRELFDAGKSTKRKVTPEEGSRILRQRFPFDEVMWLKPSQVKTTFVN